MKYVSIDLETTGLNPETCQIVEFAAVLDDLENPKPIEQLPKFQAYIVTDAVAVYHQLGEVYTGEPYALSMHSAIFRRIAKRESGFQYLERDVLMKEFRKFLVANNWMPKPEISGRTDLEHGKINITAAGKNFGVFDLPFLKKHVWDWDNIQFEHRVIDPAMFFLTPQDQKVPDSATCLKRAGLDDVVAHTALEDALMVVRLVRKGLNIQ